MTWGGRLLKLGSETKEGPGVEEGTGKSLGSALLWLLERYREAVSQGKLAVSSRGVKATVTEGSQGRDAFSPRGSRRKGGPWGQGQGSMGVLQSKSALHLCPEGLLSFYSG